MVTYVLHATPPFCAWKTKHSATPPILMSSDAAKLQMLQANLESMVIQLESKTKEAGVMAAEAAKQRELVTQLTRKLDVISKRNKVLEKETQRAAMAREGMMSASVQCDSDQVVLRAQTEAHVLAIAIGEVDTVITTITQRAREAASDAAAEVARLQEALNEATSQASAAVQAREDDAKQAATSMAEKLAELREGSARAAAAFAEQLAGLRDRLRQKDEAETVLRARLASAEEVHTLCSCDWRW